MISKIVKIVGKDIACGDQFVRHGYRILRAHKVCKGNRFAFAAHLEYLIEDFRRCQNHRSMLEL